MTLNSRAPKLDRRTHSTCVLSLATDSSVGMPKSVLTTVNRENSTAEYDVLMHSPNSRVTQETTLTEQAFVLTVWSPATSDGEGGGSVKNTKSKPNRAGLEQSSVSNTKLNIFKTVFDSLLQNTIVFFGFFFCLESFGEPYTFTEWTKCPHKSPGYIFFLERSMGIRRTFRYTTIILQQKP